MFKKILVPTDYDDLSPRPLEIATELARAGAGTAVILSVIDDSFPNPDILSFQLPWADYYQHLREEAQRRLERLRRQVGGAAEAEVCVVHGQPARQIVHFAETEGCDLIVMAAHRPGGLHHALVGSVTRRVLHMADCPVMVVRIPE